MKTCALALAMIALCSCMPSNIVQPTCTSFEHKYDDLVALPALNEELNPVGEYKGLLYEGAFVSAPGIASPYKAQSSKNVAVATMVSDALLAGTATLHPFFVITAPKDKTLNLDSFYVACGFDLHNQQADPSVRCDISIVGYRADGSQVSVQPPVSYTPGSIFDAPMLQVAKTQLGEFSNLVEVTITIDQTDLSSTTITSQSFFAIDNFKGSICSR